MEAAGPLQLFRELLIGAERIRQVNVRRIALVILS